MSGPVYEILIPTLTFLSVVAIGASILISRYQRQASLEVRLQDDRWIGVPAREETGGRFHLLRFLAQLGNLVSHGHSQKSLNEQLLRAGYVSGAAPAIYTGVKILLFGVGLVAAAALVAGLEMALSSKLMLAVLGGAILFFIPNLVVMAKLKRQQAEVHRHLPEAVDLLEVCVSSGIGLDMAWNIVAEEIRQVSPVLANAMSLTNFEVNLGVSRVDAMRHMAERTGVEELSSLATILIQTERFGTSIAETLRVFARSMREERSYTAEENSEKMAVKMIFPMVLCIFPALLVTVAGPAIITLMEWSAGGR
jgi:tight adherence protein C